RRDSSSRTAEERRKWRLLIAFSASGIVILAAVIGLIALTTGGSASAAGVATAMRDAGCTLKSVKASSRKHVTSFDAKIKYNTDPPSNGSHYYQPAVWDFYRTTAAPVQVVHNEEHGGVILWWGNKVPS